MMIKTIRSLRMNLAAIGTAVRASSEYTHAATGSRQGRNTATSHIPL